MFSITVDTSADLPVRLLEKWGVTVIPLSYRMYGVERLSPVGRDFTGQAFYEAMRRGVEVTTSQIPPQRYIDHFTPLLAKGQDILFIGLSSGVSGSYCAAEMAAAEVQEIYPERRIRLVDSYGASLGVGLLVLAAAECRERGMTLNETAGYLLRLRSRVCQIITVDDLRFLKRTGRVSAAAAVLGSALSVKPLLKGSAEGKLVLCGKERGRKRAIQALAERYRTLAVEPEGQTVGIAHAGCPEDAEALAALISRGRPPGEIITACIGPVLGAHVGPGTLGLFFLGGENVREQ